MTGGDERREDRELTVDDVLMSRNAEVRVALVSVLAKVSELADRSAGGTSTLRSKVKISWADVDRILWEQIGRYQ